MTTSCAESRGIFCASGWDQLTRYDFLSLARIQDRNYQEWRETYFRDLELDDITDRIEAIEKLSE